MIETLRLLIIFSFAIYSFLIISYVLKRPAITRLSLLGIISLQLIYLSIFSKYNYSYFWQTTGTAFYYTFGLNLVLLFNPPKGWGIYFLTVSNILVSFVSWQQLASFPGPNATLPALTPNPNLDILFYSYQFFIFLSLTLTLLQVSLVIEESSLVNDGRFRVGQGAAITLITAIFAKMWWSKNIWGNYLSFDPYENQFIAILLIQIILLNWTRINHKKSLWYIFSTILVICLVILFTVPVYEMFTGHSSYTG
jgi:hypothetical protein